MAERYPPPLDPELVLRHVLDGLLIVDTQGRVLFTNAAFREMIGRPNEDLVGRMCCELEIGAFCKDHCPVTDGNSGTCATGTTLNVRISDTQGQGRPGAYCVVMSPIRGDDGTVLGWFENFRGMDRAIDAIRRAESADAERIERALEANRWSIGRTANELGISRTTLWRRMRRYGIHRTG